MLFFGSGRITGYTEVNFPIADDPEVIASSDESRHRPGKLYEFAAQREPSKFKGAPLVLLPSHE
jgi:hypothetical protein